MSTIRERLTEVVGRQFQETAQCWMVEIDYGGTSRTMLFNTEQEFRDWLRSAADESLPSGPFNLQMKIERNDPDKWTAEEVNRQLRQ